MVGIMSFLFRKMIVLYTRATSLFIYLSVCSISVLVSQNGCIPGLEFVHVPFSLLIIRGVGGEDVELLE